jgi:hypothetical protein
VLEVVHVVAQLVAVQQVANRATGEGKLRRSAGVEVFHNPDRKPGIQRYAHGWPL